MFYYSAIAYIVHSNLRAVNINSSSVVFQWDAPVLGVVYQYNLTCTNAEQNVTVSGYNTSIVLHCVRDCNVCYSYTMAYTSMIL